MADWGVHLFCTECGAHRRHQPFNDAGWMVHGNCRKCGGYGTETETVKRARVGRWPWQRGWIDRDGEPFPGLAGSAQEEGKG